MELKEIEEFFKKNNVPSFRLKQLNDAIYKQYVSSFEEIKQFPKKLREDLNRNFNINELKLIETKKSNNTIKFLLKTKDEEYIETVLMNHNDGRRTVCVSCQIFCPLGCKFCATGANQYKRNLTKNEIIEQVLFVSRYLKNKNERVTNVVYMGMGEPFLNYENIIESIHILNDKDKFNIGARHITVSTAGIIPKIYEYAKFPLQTRLAISLHAPNNELRSKLMPINNKYPLPELMKACDEFVKLKNKRISYEYVLIDNINDSTKHAIQLVNLLKNRKAHVNLLIYNPHPFSDFKKPTIEKVKNFKKILDENNIQCSIRKSLGDDISGACGQLSGNKKSKK
jgi:23S rRNA (adenine2503-C2)-methyltransferase